jgi:hypothetical protein
MEDDVFEVGGEEVDTSSQGDSDDWEGIRGMVRGGPKIHLSGISYNPHARSRRSFQFDLLSKWSDFWGALRGLCSTAPLGFIDQTPMVPYALITRLRGPGYCEHFVSG